MKKALVLSTSAALAALVPAIAFAATINNVTDVGQFIINLINNIAVPVIFALAFIVFLWGAFQAFILGARNDKAKTEGKNLMIWGLIGFFVMVSVWGLVNILSGTISFGNNSGPTNVPKAPVNVTAP